MQEPIGIGAFKFQALVTDEMILNKNQFQQFKNKYLEGTKQIVIGPKKHKAQFMKAKDRIMEKLQNPQEREKFMREEIIADSAPNSPDGKKKKPEFILEVSSSSESDSSEGSPLNPKAPIRKESREARQNVKQLIPSRLLHQEPKKHEVAMQTLKRSLISKPIQRAPIIRKDVEYLRSLHQNVELQNNDNLDLKEYKVDKEIYIEMDCRDFMTFMRLQHEVEELRRKQQDFSRQKERHYDYVKQVLKDNMVEETNKLYTLMMAKRFISKLKGQEHRRSKIN